jgi:hypothetical protein
MYKVRGVAVLKVMTPFIIKTFEAMVAYEEINTCCYVTQRNG